MAQKNDNRNIEFVLDRFEGSKAVLLFDGQELIVPKRCLESGVKEGDVLKTEFISDGTATRRRGNLARAILQEILQGE